MKSLNKFFNKPQVVALDTFFSEILYKKDLGYYQKKNPFGKDGDFITSPGISFLFSEMLAIWIVSYWESLAKPKKINIVELGPGNGELFKILINTFKKFPSFFSSCKLFLYEKSKTLTKIQKKRLDSSNVQWISNLDKIKKGPIIFLGNEFFDAIPIKQFQKKNKIIYEKFIKIDKNYKIKTVLKRASKNDILLLQKYKLFKRNLFVEFPKLGLNELKPIIKKIKNLKGGLLLIDYGYLKAKNVSTLQSIKSHKQNSIFRNIGDSDVTSLVNFDLLKNHLSKKGLNVSKIVSQSYFLKKVGILTRAEMISKHMTFKEKSDLYTRLERLLSPKYMGELFKVLFAYTGQKKPLIGFR